MIKPAKPCDKKELRKRLPCLAPGEGECFGDSCWDKKRDCKPGQIRNMSVCPWIEEVRAYWKRKGYGK